MTEATPRPWHIDAKDSLEHVRGTSQSYGRDGIIAAMNYGDSPENRANAALIVRAVNNLDPLIEALELSLKTMLGSYENGPGLASAGFGPDGAVAIARAALLAAREATR